MSAPRRWLDDPNADPSMRDVLRKAPPARSLDVATRRRLGVKVARASAVPAVAAGWLFVKSAAAALGVVLGTGTVLVSAGVVEWSKPAPSAEPSKEKQPLPPRPAAPARVEVSAPLPVVEAPTPAPPPLPVTSFGAAPEASARSLAAEAALLEQARRELRRDANVALAVVDEHRARFPKGQLTSERLLIQVEALHRLSRDPEARDLARRLVAGPGGGLYKERVQALLGRSAVE